MSRTQPYLSRQEDWYEDQEIGVSHLTPSRTIGDGDIMLFGGLTGDLCELHTNEAYASTTEFGGRIAHGMLNLAIAHGLITRAGHLVGTGVALLGWRNISFKGPIRIGDTVQSRWTTIEKRDSASRPDAGIVVDQVELVNQHDDVVLTGEVATLVRKRPGRDEAD